MIDIETLLLRIETYLKANLNTAITALNTEKNDSLVLAQVVDDAYFLQSFNQRIANYDPHILIALDDVQGSGIGPGVAKTLVFTVVLILADTNDMDLMIGIRMLRYGRVLEDLFNRGFSKILPSANFKVNSLVPIAFTSLNSNDPYRAVGVEVVTVLG